MSFRAIRSVAAIAAFSAFAAACGSQSSPTAPSAAIIAAPSTAGVSVSGGTMRSLATSSVTPIYIDGGNGTNYTCSELASIYAPGSEWFEVKLDQAPTSGTHVITDNVITTTISNGTSTTFDWSATMAADAVFVKSGKNGHNLYLYSGESTSGAGLSTPYVDAKYQDISHISLCYDVELLVEKTASTTFTRDFDWSIAKSVSQASVSLVDNGQATVNYTVAVAKDAGTDSDWSVSGTIKVTNPHPSLAASGVSTIDNLSGFGAVPVSCPSSSLAPLASMTCSYGAVALPNGTSRTNTASADSTTYGIVQGSGDASVAFVTPTTVLDNSVNVSDTFAGAGISGALAASRTFNYSRTITSADVACGATVTLGNTASIATDDAVTRSASANVTASRTCTPPPPAATGCTLTQGYWGTHSKYGPAKYDATWAKIGEDTTFFLSGMSYYKVMQQSTGGNAYYQLAHQFIAAKLNVLKGTAAPTGVNFTLIENFFKTYTPAQIAAMKGGNAVRQQALAWASTLDSYNNGLLNAPHCGS